MKRLAITDSLTDLYTRRQLFYLGERELERFRRYGTVFSAIMLDLDDFKKINDTYGHLVGDQVLMTTAERCRQNVRSVDIIGRYGGEEFVLILPEINAEGARRSAERLRDVISASPVETDSGPVMVSASLGIAEIGPASPAAGGSNPRGRSGSIPGQELRAQPGGGVNPL